MVSYILSYSYEAQHGMLRAVDSRRFGKKRISVLSRCGTTGWNHEQISSGFPPLWSTYSVQGRISGVVFHVLPACRSKGKKSYAKENQTILLGLFSSTFKHVQLLGVELKAFIRDTCYLVSLTISFRDSPRPIWVRIYRIPIVKF